MNSILKIILCALVGLFCLFHFVPEAKSQGPSIDTKPPIMVVVTLKDGNSVTQGMPLLLQCKFTNASTEEQMIFLEDDFAWSAFELCDEKGIVSSWTPKIRKRSGANMVAGTIFPLSVPVEITDSIPAEITNVPAGKYILVLRTKIRHGAARRARSSGLPEMNNYAKETLAIPLTILPAEPKMIEDRISHLYISIVKEEDPVRQRELYYELAKMPAQYAQRTWRTLLQNPAIDRYQFADALASVVTKPIVDTLVYVQFTHPIFNENGQMRNLVNLLNGMAMSCTPEMRIYIQKEIAKHKDSIFNGPVVVD